jgi:hypothetical protein
MEPEAVRILKWVYLAVFAVAGAFALMLTFSTNSIFEVLRFSNVVQASNGFPILTIFRLLVGFYLILILIDAVSLFNYRSSLWREVSAVASLIGIVLMGLGSLFMVYILAAANLVSNATAVLSLLYLVVAVGLFLLDLLTFFVEEEGLLGVAIKKRKSK